MRWKLENNSIIIGKEVLLMLPEERAREKNDKQLSNSGWDIVPRDEYVPRTASAVKEA